MQKRIMLLVLLLLAAFARSSSHAQNGLAERMLRVEKGLLPAVVIKGQSAGQSLTERMRHYNVPGVSVAVINNGKLEWAKGYGVVQAGCTTPVTAETLFQAASISKPVAVIGALAMAEKKKLTLDENVNLRLKSWRVPDNEFTKEEAVTLRRLASHSAGLTVHGFAGYAAGLPVPSTAQVLDGQKPANSAPVRVNVKPGSLWRYSGSGITVMQLLMSDVAGQPFPALMRELALNKLGMKNSTYEQPLPASFAARAAGGHLNNGELVKGKWHTYPEMAAAGLWTTPSDLASFAIEIQQAKAGSSKKVLSQAMTTQMLTKQSGDYGLGMALGGSGRAAPFSHGGSNEGFKCMMFAYVETGQGAVVMTNGNQGSALANEILRSIAREYGWPDFQPVERTVAQVNPALFAEYVGEYEVFVGKVVVTTEGGKLYVQPPRQSKQELLPSSETEFFLSSENIKVVFTKDAQGAVKGAQVHLGGRVSEGKKIK